MNLKPILDEGAANANMAETQVPLHPRQARVEADRCLYCFDAPCIQACPTGIDVPAFIRKIAGGNATGAAKTILQANILGASCARVCPTKVLCEGACVMHDRDEKPIEIGRLQRFATDYVTDRGIQVLSPPSTKRTHRIAVVGSGPAGLGCAAELAQLGYRVTVFERAAQPGGLNTHGIAYYKMKPHISLAEVKLVEGLGIELKCGVDVGRDVTGETLTREFDAVFLGIGLGAGNWLGIPNEELPEVCDALTFIESLRRSPLHQVPVGHQVVVLGGGNTAIDAAVQAAKLGAKRVTLVYRGCEADMSAYDFECAKAKDVRVHFQFETIPVAVVELQGHVSGIRLARTRRRAGTLEAIPNSEFTLECDMILKAVGQTKQGEAMRRIFPTLELNANGTIQRVAESGATNIANVFVGGDCANGGREVVNAVGEGKIAAHGIHALLSGNNATLPIQSSRHGVVGSPIGSGLHGPVRAHELEAQWEQASG